MIEDPIMDELYRKAGPKLAPTADPGPGVAVTEEMVDAEMGRRVWARYLSGFLAEDGTELPGPIAPLRRDEGRSDVAYAIIDAARFIKNRSLARAALESIVMFLSAVQRIGR